jgi:2-polyprenyl-3-methyl-5-hydroxy-6-metoxy-1,4-benzoquinol methylase
MCNQRLNILATENNKSRPPSNGSKNDWRREAQANFERMWLVDPEQFNPLRNCIERERIDRTWKLAQDFLLPKDKLVADLACGGGVMSKRLKDAGATVHALDIASNALKTLLQNVPNIDQTYQQCLPHTTLEDDAYDLVFGDEVIAYLPAQQLRLFMAELSRLIKPKGFAICSTNLDLDTQDPLLRFASLAETEFKIHQWVCSHHRLHIRLKDFFTAPERYARAYNDADYKQQQLQKRRGFSQKWFRWNSQGPLAMLWSVIQYLAYPIAQPLKQNRTLMLFLEKICSVFWGDAGISHATFIASRRPLQPLELPKDEIPIERKGKRQVWE